MYVRSIALAATAIVLAALAPACTQPPRPRLDGPVEPAGPVAEGVKDVMQAKLLHSNQLLNAISLEDFRQVEQHAGILSWLSEQAEWRVHTTVSYGLFSESFRRISDAMVEHARARDIEAVNEDYARMSIACTECHAYLKREGLWKDTPGILSMNR